MTYSKSRKPEPLRQTLAASVRHYREVNDLTQPALADLMKLVLGFKWADATVAKVEAGTRRLTAEELLGLSLVLRTPIADFIHRDGSPDVEVLVGTHPFSGRELASAMSGPTTQQAAVALTATSTLTVGLTGPARAVITGDTEMRDVVEKRMADWEEAMRLLGEDVSDARRRERRRLIWTAVAKEHESEAKS